MPQYKEFENRAATLAAVIAIGIESDASDVPHPVAIGRAVGEIIKLAKSLDSLAVAACNRQLTETEERKVERQRARIKEILEPFNFTARTSGDPRGAVVKLLDKRKPLDAQGDSFGNDGWPVY